MSAKSMHIDEALYRIKRYLDQRHAEPMMISVQFKNVRGKYNAEYVSDGTGYIQVPLSDVRESVVVYNQQTMTDGDKRAAEYELYRAMTDPITDKA